MDTIMMQGFLGVFPYLVIAGAILWIFKLIHDYITSYDDDAEIRSGTFSVGFSRGAMYVGLILAMAGSLFSPQVEYLMDLGVFALEGAIAVAIMTGASFLFDKVMLPHIDNRKEIGNGNMAVAILESSGYVGVGFIFLCSFAGEGSGDIGQDILSSLVFSVLGMLVLMLTYGGFTVIYSMVRKHRVSEEVKTGNIAIAVQAAGVVQAMSIVLGFSLIGEFTGLVDDVLSFLLAALFGVLSVAIAQGISWLVFLRGYASHSNGKHGANLASASINASLLVSFGLVSGVVSFV